MPVNSLVPVSATAAGSNACEAGQFEQEYGRQEQAAAQCLPDRVVVINDDCVQSGGAASIAIATALVMRGRGFPVTFLTGDDLENPTLAEAGVEICRLGGKHLLSGPRASAAVRGLYDGSTQARLAKWIAGNNSPRTVYHLHNWHKYLTPSIFAPLRQVEARLVLSLHDFFLVCPNGGYFNFPAGMVCDVRPLSLQCLSTLCDKRNAVHKIWRTVRHTVRSSMINFSVTNATLVAVHEGMLPLLERGGIAGPQVRVMHNPVTPWLNERVAAEQNKSVLFVGRLEKDKGIHLLVEAADKLKMDLTVIGDGPLRGELENRFPEVRFLGPCTKEQIATAARKARVVAMPTLVRETFGLVAMEAMSSGVPVIISDASFIAPGIVENEGGLSVEAGSLSSLTTALHQVAADDEAVAKMSRHAFASARAQIRSAEGWGKELLKLYAEKLAPCAKERPDPSLYKVGDAAE